MTTAIERQANRLAVLRAVAQAAQVAAREGNWWGARVDEVAFELGRTRRDLLNAKRERLMSELRRDGLISYKLSKQGPGWKPTEAGLALLEGHGTSDSEPGPR